MLGYPSGDRKQDSMEIRNQRGYEVPAPSTSMIKHDKHGDVDQPTSSTAIDPVTFPKSMLLPEKTDGPLRVFAQGSKKPMEL